MTIIQFNSRNRYKLRSNFGGYVIPDRYCISLDRYINDGIDPGSFLRAVLANNLIETVNRCDDASDWLYVKVIARWIFQEAPSCCWGSEESVNNYMADKQKAMQLAVVAAKEELNDGGC